MDDEHGEPWAPARQAAGSAKRIASKLRRQIRSGRRSESSVADLSAGAAGIPGTPLARGATNEGAKVLALRSQVDTLKRQVNETRRALNEQITDNRSVYAASLKATRQELTLLRREVEKAQQYAYGSYTPGVAGWDEKWRSSPGRRVLLYAWKDYSGSFLKWAQAINKHTPYAARLAVFNQHAYQYNLDLLFPHPSARPSGFLELLDECDIVHAKDETGFFTGSNGLPSTLLEDADKRTVFTHYGGYARRYRDDPAYREYVLGFDARIAMTPDLCYEWFAGSFIPHAVDTEAFPYSWLDGRTLSHSPSTMDRKGTELLVDAVDGLTVDFDLIHGVPHEECLQRKQRANLFFDQAGREVEKRLGTDAVIGWYGNSALEAAVHGIPTIAHLSEDAFAGAARAGRDIRDQCAIINTPPTAEGIRSVVEAYFASSPEHRLALSRSTRRWVEDFHSYPAVAAELERLYDRTLGVAWTAPQTTEEAR